VLRSRTLHLAPGWHRVMLDAGEQEPASGRLAAAHLASPGGNVP
jgi:hypothetical protein